MANIFPEAKTYLKETETEFLNNLICKGGPDPEEYDRFISLINNLQPSEIDAFRELISEILNTNTLIGHGYVKPFGYPGDFSLIDNIYQFKVNEDPKFKKWDLFFHEQPATSAVRNRKDHFVKYCGKLVQEKENPKVLILGSGPGSDVFEFLDNYIGNNNITFELVDFDQSAIDFSKKKNEKFKGAISFNRINALRYNTYQFYDLIWSAGLFDYFKDKHFTFLIRKYINCLKDDGEMIISNFSTRNPTNRLMEVLSDWSLNLRTESDLFRIALNANISKEHITIDKEPLGINLFLKIKKK